MRVIVWPASRDASSWYRLRWPAEALKAQGVDVRVLEGDREGPRILWDRKWVRTPGDAQVIGCDRPDADVVVLQRPARRYWAEAIPFIQAHGVKVIVDVDDDFTRIPRDNAAWWTYNGGEKHAHGKWITRACQAADLVTVSTPALLKVYGYGHGVVVPNMVPDAYLRIRPRKWGRSVGWSGQVGTHPTDLQVTGGAVGRALAEHPDWVCRIVGTGHDVQHALELPAPAVGTGWVPILDYAHRLARLDVGVVPLTDSLFNAGKCVELGMRVSTLRGMREIGELAIGDHVWSVSGWVPVEATERQPKRRGIAIRTKNGRQVKVTKDHRMWVNGEWLTADRIGVGDTLEIVPGGRTDAATYVLAPWPSDSRISRVDQQRGQSFLLATDGPKVAVNERWGRFLGLFLGDGSVGQATNLQIHCDGQDADLIAAITEDFRAFGLTPNTQAVTTWGGEVLRRRSVGSASANLVRFLHGLGFVEWDGKNVGKGHQAKVFAVPRVIWESPSTVQAAFLSGLFEADGTASKSLVSFTTKSEKLAQDVQLLLGTFGIDTTIRERWNTAKPGGVKHRSYLLWMRRHGTDIFEKEIGFLSSRKRARLAAITCRPHSNAYTTPNWLDPVVSVESVDIETMDIQVQGSEFVAEGLRTHNSALKMAEMAALGVPVVASATPDNQRLHDLGVGLLANSPQRWWKHLTRIMRDDDLRAELAAHGRAVMAGQTYTAQADRWASAWQAPLRRKVAA